MQGAHSPSPASHKAQPAEKRPKSGDSSRSERWGRGEPRLGSALPRTNRADTADVPDRKFIDLSSFGRRKQTRTRNREGVFR